MRSTASSGPFEGVGVLHTQGRSVIKELQKVDGQGGHASYAIEALAISDERVRRLAQQREARAREKAE